MTGIRSRLENHNAAGRMAFASARTLEERVDACAASNFGVRDETGLDWNDAA
jgi:hypothetical protein